MKQYMSLAIASIFVGSFSSCITSPDEANTANELVKISTRVSPYSGSVNPEDNQHDDLTAYFFVDNIFTEKRAVTGETLSAFIEKKKANTVYFVTNPALFKDLASLTVGSSDASALLSATTEISTPDAGAKMFMASSLDLNSAGEEKTVDLIRGVARLDVTLADPDLSISAIRVKNTASQSLLWTGSASKPATTSYTKTFATPATTAIPGVFYLYEHSNIADCTVEVDIIMKGHTTTARATLPTTITRNTLYEVAVKGTPSNTVKIDLNIKEWGIGGVVEAIPD